MCSLLIFLSIRKYWLGSNCLILCHLGIYWQGYILYSVKEKLKPEYVGLPGDKIKSLKASGIMVTVPETSLHSPKPTWNLPAIKMALKFNVSSFPVFVNWAVWLHLLRILYTAVLFTFPIVGPHDLHLLLLCKTEFAPKPTLGMLCRLQKRSRCQKSLLQVIQHLILLQTRQIKMLWMRSFSLWR